MPDTESKMAELISQPKSYENDGEKITNFTPQELAAADAFIAQKKAARNPFRALKIARMSTQGPEK
jgi:hypothetical protein